MKPEYESYQPYEITYYNADENTEKLDVLLYEPHGYKGMYNHPDGIEFFDIFDEFVSNCLVPKKDVEWLCRAEGDRFCPEIGYATAKKLAEKGFKVGFFRTLLPREIIDANRTIDRAIKPIFDYQKYPDWYAYWETMYAKVMKEKDKFYQKINAGKDSSQVYFEIHSMRSFEIKSEFSDMLKIPEDQHDFAAWKTFNENNIEFLRNPKYWSINRPNCFIDRVVDIKKHELGPLIADETFTHELVEEFKRNEIIFNHNVPYSLQEHYPGTHYMRRYRGVLIDFLKDDFSTIKAIDNDSGYDLANLSEKPGAIEKMAEIITSATEKTLKKAQ